jgi:hypothetical protein
MRKKEEQEEQATQSSKKDEEDENTQMRKKDFKEHIWITMKNLKKNKLLRLARKMNKKKHCISAATLKDSRDNTTIHLKLQLSYNNNRCRTTHLNKCC